MNNISLNNNLITFQKFQEATKGTRTTALVQPQQESVNNQYRSTTKNETKKENFIFRTMRKHGDTDPKKTLKAVGLTILTVAGLAYVGNKTFSKGIDLGSVIDEKLTNSDLYKGFKAKTSQFKSWISKTLKKSDTINEISNTLKNKKAEVKWDMARGYGRGFSSIFSLTPVEIMKNYLSPLKSEEGIKALKELVGDKKASEYYNKIMEQNGAKITDRITFCQELLKEISNTHGFTNKKQLIDFLKDITKNGEFVNVNMTDKGLMAIPSAWWPVNIIRKGSNLVRKGISKITGKQIAPSTFGYGNLGNSLLKFGAVNGQLADTGLGKLAQRSIVIPTESISNFVNDKSGLGFFLGLGYINMYKNAQDAPKKQKVSTVLNEFIGTMGSFALATPFAYKATYGLASLKNIEGEGFFKSIARNIGKVFGLGLDKKITNEAGEIIKEEAKKGALSTLKGLGGGALRFILIMGVFSGLISKPIRKITTKLFGKPYDKAEAEKEKQLEAQKKAIIPELGISQEELAKKIQSNPKLVQELQQNPKAIELIQKNPKALVDLLDGKTVEQIEQQTKTANTKPKDLSTASKNLLNSRVAQPKMPTPTLNSEPIANETKNNSNTRDTATYIPSSDAAPNQLQPLSPDEQSEYDDLMQKAQDMEAKTQEVLMKTSKI